MAAEFRKEGFEGYTESAQYENEELRDLVTQGLLEIKEAEKGLKNTVQTIKSNLFNKPLQKGQYITPEEVEEITGISRKDYKEYNLAALNLKTIIFSKMMEEGLIVTIRSEQDGLRILTDWEASMYNAKAVKSHIKGISKSVTRQKGVNTSEFTPEQNVTHLQRVTGMSLILQAVKSTPQTVDYIPHKPLKRKNSESVSKIK